MLVVVVCCLLVGVNCLLCFERCVVRFVVAWCLAVFDVCWLLLCFVVVCRLLVVVL